MDSQGEIVGIESVDHRVRRERFMWSEELHKSFLLAIYEIGIQGAKPRALMEDLKSLSTEITNSQIKRNLAKLRADIEESKRDFLRKFNESVKHAKSSNMQKRKGSRINFHVYPFSSMKKVRYE